MTGVPDRPPPRPPAWNRPPPPPPRVSRPRREPLSPAAWRMVGLTVVLAVAVSVLLCAFVPPLGCVVLPATMGVYVGLLVWARGGRGRRIL